MPTTDPQAPQPSSPFTPLFTLVSNTSASTSTGSSSTEYHHPTVHYIFSDDPDPNDPITTAALQSLNPSSSPSPSSPDQADHQPPSNNPPHGNERFLILDLDPTGTKITNASSMSPEWAITSAALEKAPSWEGEEAEEEGKKRMMLRIEGCEVGGTVLGEKEEVGVGIEELVSRFEKGMGDLRRVVEMGGKGV
ncbi:MAG: hypothetical protein Q9221_004056 [Calogaya cf. arnoldii]